MRSYLRNTVPDWSLWRLESKKSCPKAALAHSEDMVTRMPADTYSVQAFPEAATFAFTDLGTTAPLVPRQPSTLELLYMD